MFQDDFRQQVFEVLVEIFREESQNRLGGGQVTKHHQPGEAVQSLEQLQERWEPWALRESGRGPGLSPLPATHCYSRPTQPHES